MYDATFKKIELVGTSTTTVEDAVGNALTKAGSTLHGLRWFEVMETRGSIDDDKVSQWQVTLRVALRLDD